MLVPRLLVVMALTLDVRNVNSQNVEVGHSQVDDSRAREEDAPINLIKSVIAAVHDSLMKCRMSWDLAAHLTAEILCTSHTGPLGTVQIRSNQWKREAFVVLMTKGIRLTCSPLDLSLTQLRPTSHKVDGIPVKSKINGSKEIKRKLAGIPKLKGSISLRKGLAFVSASSRFRNIVYGHEIGARIIDRLLSFNLTSPYTLREYVLNELGGNNKKYPTCGLTTGPCIERRNTCIYLCSALSNDVFRLKIFKEPNTEEKHLTITCIFSELVKKGGKVTSVAMDETRRMYTLLDHQDKTQTVRVIDIQSFRGQILLRKVQDVSVSERYQSLDVTKNGKRLLFVTAKEVFQLSPYNMPDQLTNDSLKQVSELNAVDQRICSLTDEYIVSVHSVFPYDTTIAYI